MQVGIYIYYNYDDASAFFLKLSTTRATKALSWTQLLAMQLMLFNKGGGRGEDKDLEAMRIKLMHLVWVLCICCITFSWSQQLHPHPNLVQIRIASDKVWTLILLSSGIASFW